MKYGMNPADGLFMHNRSEDDEFNASLLSAKQSRYSKTISLKKKGTNSFKAEIKELKFAIDKDHIVISGDTLESEITLYFENQDIMKAWIEDYHRKKDNLRQNGLIEAMADGITDKVLRNNSKLDELAKYEQSKALDKDKSGFVDEKQEKKKWDKPRGHFNIFKKILDDS